jgi:hypothetical protein
MRYSALSSETLSASGVSKALGATYQPASKPTLAGTIPVVCRQAGPVSAAAPPVDSRPSRRGPRCDSAIGIGGGAQVQLTTGDPRAADDGLKAPVAIGLIPLIGGLHLRQRPAQSGQRDARAVRVQGDDLEAGIAALLHRILEQRPNADAHASIGDRQGQVALHRSAAAVDDAHAILARSGRLGGA